jgi:hypothetical protein
VCVVCVCVRAWAWACVSSRCAWSFLMEVSFSGCSSNSWEQMSVTDDGLRCLAALPSLVSLSMSYLANVSDIALEAIASRGKLRKLMCRGCPSFTDVGCIRYLSFLQNSCSHVHLSVATHYCALNSLINSICSPIIFP